MKVRPEESNATVQVVQLVAAIVNYAGTSGRLLEIAGKLWPQLQVHRGHTHLRLLLAGKAEGDSIYVELG